MKPKNFDDVDVKAALERETQDGPGTDDVDALPESDTDNDAEGDDK